MEIFKDIKFNKISESNYTCEAGINESHAILKAHFPGAPIIPGVVLLQFAGVALSKVTQQKIKLIQAGNVKFVKPVIPDDGKLLRLDFSCVYKQGIYTVNGSLYYGEDVSGHFKNILYTKAD